MKERVHETRDVRRSGLETLRASRSNAGKRFPDTEDRRSEGNLIFPALTPGFELDASARVFTIGSCFARNIEIVLEEYSVNLPTMRFSVDSSEWPFRPNGLLNQYNPGTMSQRILSSLGLREEPEATIVESGDGFLDLLLPGGSPVSIERARDRRREIDAIYEELVTSDLVVITLGLVECWRDEATGTYLNRMPPSSLVKRQPDRYTFHRLSPQECTAMLDEALTGLIDADIQRVLLTVSPVPLGTTFTQIDATVANGYSKAVLRVCAEELTAKHPQIEYFPSFEIVTSGGTGAFKADNIHVRPRVVDRVTRYMLEAYFPTLVSARNQS